MVSNIALYLDQSEEMKLLNISFPRVGIESTTRRVYSHTVVPLRHDWRPYLGIWNMYSVQEYLTKLIKVLFGFYTMSASHQI